MKRLLVTIFAALTLSSMAYDNFNEAFQVALKSSGDNIVAAFAEAETLAPNTKNKLKAIYWCAQRLLQNKKNNAALAMMRRQLELPDLSANEKIGAYNNVGNLLSHMKKYNEARAEYEKGLKVPGKRLSRAYAKTNINIGKLLFLQGKDAQAIKALKKVVADMTVDINSKQNARLVIWSALYNKGDKDTVITEAKESLKDHKIHIVIQMQTCDLLAKCYDSQTKYAEACEVYKKLLQNPSLITIHKINIYNKYVPLLVKNGKNEETVKACTAALALPGMRSYQIDKFKKIKSEITQQ